MTAPGAPARALASAVPAPYWLDRPKRPVARPRLVGDAEADLVVVGGGFTGLWAALQAVEEDPGRRVVLLEGDRVAEGATGRNGGFCAASLTHGLGNGVERFGPEMPTLLRMGAETLDAIEQAVHRHDIRCDFERTGEMDVAVAPWHVAALAEQHRLGTGLGLDLRLLDADAVRAEVDSPTYLAGLHDPDGVAMLDPARLAWGLAAAVQRLGVTLHEHTRVTDLALDGAGVRVRTAHGSVRAGRVLLATSAFPPVLRRTRAYVVPVWDYALVTEPLPADVRASLGWAGRQGIGDVGNRFHYYRLTPEPAGEGSGWSPRPEEHPQRVLFGGYDALYFAGGRTDPRLAQHPATFALLAEHLVTTFPQLADVAVTHTWGGMIDTCSRFSAFWGRALRGRGRLR